MAVVILTFMALAFRSVTSAPLQNFDAVAPDGTVVGIIGENGAGKSRLLRLAAGLETPTSGTVKASGDVRLLGPDDALNLAPAPVLLIDRTFGHQDLLVRERAAVALDRIRRAGATTLLVSHEEELIRRLADEVWWLHQGKLAGRGDPEADAGGLSQARRRQAARLGRKHHAAAGPHSAPRRWPRRDRARRDHRRKRQAHHGLAQRRTRRGAEWPCASARRWPTPWSAS